VNRPGGNYQNCTILPVLFSVTAVAPALPSRYPITKPETRGLHVRPRVSRLGHITVFRRSKSLVGLDIGSSAIKAVELKAAGRGYRVAAYGTEPLPPDSIVDGAIIDAAAVAEAIRRLFDGRGIRTREVAASLSGNAVIVKKITLSAMTEAELADSIYWEAEQYIPFDIQDVNLDYQVLEGPEGKGKGTIEVLLVAAKKEKIADYTGVIAQAGRSAVVVDVDAFALQNAYEVNYGTDPGAVVVLLNAGASATNINILNGDQSVFTRDVSIGGNAYTEALQRELSLPYAAADQLKRGTGVDGIGFEDARPVLRAVTENVMLEIQKTFDFFKATADSDRIDRIVVSGGASREEGFTELLRERFESPVEAFDPFKKIGFDPRKLGSELGEVAPTAAVAIGLALRRAGDR
jgi:type IV pilus assembly protein PilM